MRNDSINNALRTIILGSVVVWTVVGILPGNVSAIELPSDVQEFLEINCTGCHDSVSNEGDLDLESLQLGLANPDNFHIWERVFDRVREGEMPPDEPLDEAEASQFLESLQEILKGFDEARIQSDGRVPARRLTRAQYERNVSELLSVNLPLGDYLPEDSLTNRFDTVANSQQISDHSMAAYLEAADAALDAAFAQVMTEAAPMRSRLNWERLRRDENNTNRQSEGRPKHQDIVAWSTRQNFYVVCLRQRLLNLPDTESDYASMQSTLPKMAEYGAVSKAVSVPPRHRPSIGLAASKRPSAPPSTSSKRGFATDTCCRSNQMTVG